jgi:hypothetical protein
MNAKIKSMSNENLINLRDEYNSVYKSNAGFCESIKARSIALRCEVELMKRGIEFQPVD